ncbi:Outer membrane protein P1 precursor [compost metagenome]
MMIKPKTGCLLCLSLSTWAHAGGIMLDEIGTDNTGLVNAGSAARAQGPSTIASNPAGLSYLDGTQIAAGAQLLFGDLSFERDSSTTSTGGNGGNALPLIPGANLFVSHQVDEQWSLGLGFYGDFGLALDYDDDWAGRYQIQDPSIIGVSLVPSASYRFNDEWSLGLGLRAMYAMLDSEAAIDRAPFGLLDRADGQFSYEDQTWGYGARVGVIHAPRPGTRIGLAYSSSIDLDFDERLDVDGSDLALARLDDSKLQLDMKVPQTLTLSLYEQIDQQWAVLATLNWQDWSEFGEIGVEVDTTAGSAQAQTIDANYKDTWQLALGAQYRATARLLWNAGVAYDSSAVSDSDRSVLLPMAASWRLGTGATYRLDQDTDLNFSWDLIWFGDMPVEQTKPLSGERLSGEFKDAWVQTLTGNMTWRF